MSALVHTRLTSRSRGAIAQRCGPVPRQSRVLPHFRCKRSVTPIARRRERPISDGVQAFSAPHPAGLVVDRVVTDTERVIITTHSSATQAACPACGHLSSRTHSHYARTLADLPWQGRPVFIRVRARRFRCATVECPRQVFAERLASVASCRARRSQRLGDIQRHIGLAVGGEPGSRLAHRLAMPVSGDTLLRLIRSARWKAPEAPRVIGIDEWAWKRGQTYGTILCDLEKGRVWISCPTARPAQCRPV